MTTIEGSVRAISGSASVRASGHVLPGTGGSEGVPHRPTKPDPPFYATVCSHLRPHHFERTSVVLDILDTANTLWGRDDEQDFLLLHAHGTVGTVFVESRTSTVVLDEFSLTS